MVPFVRDQKHQNEDCFHSNDLNRERHSLPARNIWWNRDPDTYNIVHHTVERAIAHSLTLETVDSRLRPCKLPPTTGARG